MLARQLDSFQVRLEHRTIAPNHSVPLCNWSPKQVHDGNFEPPARVALAKNGLEPIRNTLV